MKVVRIISKVNFSSSKDGAPLIKFAARY